MGRVKEAGLQAEINIDEISSAIENCLKLIVNENKTQSSLILENKLTTLSNLFESLNGDVLLDFATINVDILGDLESKISKKEYDNIDFRILDELISILERNRKITSHNLLDFYNSNIENLNHTISDLEEKVSITKDDTKRNLLKSEISTNKQQLLVALMAKSDIEKKDYEKTDWNNKIKKSFDNLK